MLADDAQHLGVAHGWAGAPWGAQQFGRQETPAAGASQTVDAGNLPAWLQAQYTLAARIHTLHASSPAEAMQPAAIRACHGVGKCLQETMV